MFSFLMVIFILDIILLVPTILLQSGSGAQSGVFGSDLTMGAFGAKTSEVLVNFTKWLVGIFFATAFLMSYIKIREYNNYTHVRQVQEAPGQHNGNIIISNNTTNSLMNTMTNLGLGTNK
jgi:protein translocase SecG subunit